MALGASVTIFQRISTLEERITTDQLTQILTLKNEIIYGSKLELFLRLKNALKGNPLGDAQRAECPVSLLQWADLVVGKFDDQAYREARSFQISWIEEGENKMAPYSANLVFNLFEKGITPSVAGGLFNGEVFHSPPAVSYMFTKFGHDGVDKVDFFYLCDVLASSSYFNNYFKAIKNLL